MMKMKKMTKRSPEGTLSNLFMSPVMTTQLSPSIPRPIASPYFNKHMNYYICSSGGCGSTVLFRYLKDFGNVYHIHDRYPPENLCYVGNENTTENVYSEWFNSTKIPQDKLSSYKVIFIYRNPIDVIFTRCATHSGPNIEHLRHIKCKNDGNIWFGDVIQKRQDLYGLEEFFDHYTTPKNYPIYCVKYEQLFNNWSLLNQVLEIPDIPSLYPKKSERAKKITYFNELTSIYASLMYKMNTMPFIKKI
jgi:hypothetical protein